MTALLIIIDGFGANPNVEGNAVAAAKTPNLDLLWSNYPHTLLKAAEEEVGLAFGQIGNSEVGHMAIGTGRVVPSGYQKINSAIEDGSFFKNEAFLKAINHTSAQVSRLHLIGMISQAGVHADLNHLTALIKLAKKEGVEKLFLHPILDGRDTGPREAIIYLDLLQKAIDEEGLGKIATVAGRAYAMDRNENWEKTKSYYDALIGVSPETGTDAQEVVKRSYSRNIDDESVPPTDIDKEGALSDGDAVIITNFREDRARQLVKSLLSDFTQFPRNPYPKDLFVATMTQYEYGLPVAVAFPPSTAPNTLSDIIEASGGKQLHLAETEKYAHVTYFFNSGRERPLPNEDFVNIPSDPPSLFLKNPQMKAREITDYLLTDLASQKHSFYVVNFANPDMIGHTGDFEKTIAAVEAVDTAIGRIYPKAKELGAPLFVTADHGNAEQKIDLKTGLVSKDHTVNPVPFILVAPKRETKGAVQRITFGAEVTGILQDIAPTIIKALGLSQPAEMTGSSLF